MGFESPKRLEPVKQIKPSQLISESQIFWSQATTTKETGQQKQIQARQNCIEQAKPNDLH
jgi:hypothetical protein